MNIVLQPVALKDFKKLNELKGGQCFVFWEAGQDINELVESGEIFIFVKDSIQNGSVKVLNLSDGLLMQRDADRKVVLLDSTLTVAITESAKL